MRTITVSQLNDLIDQTLYCLKHYGVDPKRCPWFPFETSLSLDIAMEGQLATARKKARRKIKRLGATSPIETCLWLSYVLKVWTLRYVIRQQRAEMCTQDEVDLLFIAALGTEIKRLGFQLAL
jgi:hypothetical protein